MPLINGQYYHVYNRVAAGRKLFYTEQHYLFYLKLWKEVDFSPCCRICVYCLMPTHYHYLVHITDAALFPKKISYFFNCYLKTLNSVRHETERYFENRFQARLIDSEDYLLTICGYIHLNPVNANLVASVEQWPYSNYLEFMRQRCGTLWDRAFFDQYIRSPANYEQYLRSKYREEGLTPYIFEED